MADRSVQLEIATLEELVAATFDFYDAVPASGLVADACGDMLLFQFGTYDWGRGRFFEIDITRQFIVNDEEDDNAISQLHCTVCYEPTAALGQIGAGDQWCDSRDKLPDFKAFVLTSAAYLTARPLRIERRLVSWGEV